MNKRPRLLWEIDTGEPELLLGDMDAELLFSSCGWIPLKM